LFSQAVIENLDHYVYFLQDPRTDDVFYIGKGSGNRIFDHLECAIETDDDTEKLTTIREIIKSGYPVKHYILRHAITEQTAFEIESSLLDFVGIKNLSNIQGGHDSSDYGLKTVDEISAMYEIQNLSTDLPIMLININKLYKREMSEIDLYEATRKSWVVGPRRNKAQYAVATYRGLTREIYSIKEWHPIKVKGKIRWGFTGEKPPQKIREALRYKSITSFFRQGAANPIKYINC
jgi:hypothetical protein